MDPRGSHCQISNPRSFTVLVTGHDIDCNIPAQHTHTARLNPQSDPENGGSMFLRRASIHLCDSCVTTQKSPFQTIIQYFVFVFFFFSVFCYTVCYMSLLDSNSPVFSVSIELSLKNKA